MPFADAPTESKSKFVDADAPTKPKEAPKEWETARGNKPAATLLDYLNPFKGMNAQGAEEKIQATHDAYKNARGFTGSLMDAAGATEGPVSKFVGENVIDPAVGAVSALGPGLSTIPYGDQIGSAVGAFNKWAGPKIASLISSDPQSELNPTPVADVGATMGSDVKAALLNNTGTVAALAAPVVGKVFKGVRGEPVAAPESVGVPANEAVDTLQKQFKPGKTTESARDFEKDAPAAINDIVAQNENVGQSKSSTPHHDRFIEMANQAKRPYGEAMGAMIEEGKRSGQYYDPSNLWGKMNSEVNKPIVQLFSPEFSQKIADLRARFPDQMPLDVAHQLASDISDQLRKMDNQIGVAEDVTSQNAKYNMMKTLELDIRDQLNSKLSPTTDAWRDASQRYGAISRLQDLAETSKSGVRGGSDASVGQLIQDAAKDAAYTGAAGFLMGGPHGGLAGAAAGAVFPLIKRAISRGAADRAVGRIINIADKNPVPEPVKPTYPQRATLPQVPTRQGANGALRGMARPQINEVTPELQDKFNYRASMMNPAGDSMKFSNETGQREPSLEPWSPPKPESTPESPGLPIPDFASNAMKAAISPENMLKDAQTVQKIVGGKSKVSYAEAIKTASPWAKALLKNLVDDPNAANTIAKIVEGANKKANPF